MPGKHVRFGRTNVITYPAPRSLPLSPPPFTFLGGTSIPHSRATSPPAQSETFLRPSDPSFPPFPQPTRLHTLLQFSSSPLLNFDLRQPPSTITSHHRGIQLRALSEPVTEPPLAAFTVIIPYLPWSVIVYPSHRGTYVTVEDVLEQLYHMLRTNISAQEYYSLPSAKDQGRVTAAYEQRYRRIRGSCENEDEKRCGVKRVDFLMGQTKFLGFSPSATRPDVWVLQFT